MTVRARLDPLSAEEWARVRRRTREVAADAGLVALIALVALVGIVAVSVAVSFLGAVAGVLGFVLAWLVAFGFAFLVPVVALKLGAWLYVAAGV